VNECIWWVIECIWWVNECIWWVNECIWWVNECIVYGEWMQCIWWVNAVYMVSEWVYMMSDWVYMMSEWVYMMSDWVYMVSECSECWVFARIWMMIVHGECWVNVGVKSCPFVTLPCKLLCVAKYNFCIRLFENKLKLKPIAPSLIIEIN